MEMDEDQPEVSITIEERDLEEVDEENCKGRACIVINHQPVNHAYPQGTRLILAKGNAGTSKNIVKVVPVRIKQETIDDIPDNVDLNTTDNVDNITKKKHNLTTKHLGGVLRFRIKREYPELQQYSEPPDVKPNIHDIDITHRDDIEEADKDFISDEEDVQNNQPNAIKKEFRFQCELCDRTYSHARTLEAHKLVCGKVGRLRKSKSTDPSCSREFINKIRKTEHCENNHVLKTEFSDSFQFDRNDSEFVCPKCQVSFPQVSALRLHQKKCNKIPNDKIADEGSESENICCISPDCKKEFVQKSQLNEHIEENHPDIKGILKPVYNYVCEKCKRGFDYFSSFKIHSKACGERSKLAKTPCVYPSCKREFFHKCRLVQHITEDHPELEYTEPDLTYKCPRCHKEYLHLRSMHTHLKTCGQIGKLKKAKCIAPSCSREYFHKSRLIEHIKKDHPEMDTDDIISDNIICDNGFKCDNCNVVYTSRQSLLRHKETCKSGEKLKKTQCIHQNCEKKFFHISSMMKHVEVEHADLKIAIVEKRFESLPDFKQWKEEEELRTFSYFSTRHSVTSSEGKAYLSYVCQFNGPDRYPSASGEYGRNMSRKWKKGRVKTGLVCPARMLVKELSKGAVSVKYVQTHNHEIDKDNFTYPPFAQKSVKRVSPGSERNGNEVRILENPCEERMDTSHEGAAEIEENVIDSEVFSDEVVDMGYFDCILKPNCGYVLSLEKASETVNLYQQRTSSRFVCYKVQRGFGREEWTIDNRKIIWQQEETRENTIPEFDGVPYILNGTKVMECQYGVNRSGYQRKFLDNKKNDLWKDDSLTKHVSKKVDCPAKIYLKDLIKFPDFKIEENTREAKKNKSNLLKAALREGQVVGERRIYIQFPAEKDHCNHKKGLVCKPRKPRGTKLSLVPIWETELNDADFLHTFRVTKSVYQHLVDEWHRMEVARLEAAGTPTEKRLPLDQFTLAGLYYLGTTDNVSTVSAKFKVKAVKLLESVIMFADFLLAQQNNYIKWPPVEERVKIAEIIKHDCGFPGVFGAMDAALIHTSPPADDDDKLNYTYLTMEDGSRYGFVMQFVVDHRLMFRDIHLDAPKTGTRFQVFQESDAWIAIQNLTSAETHLVAPAVYPLAPAVMTPHMTETLTYQEALFNDNHSEAHKLAANAMTVFKSRFRRLQLLDEHVETSGKLIKAACILHNFALMEESETVLNDLGLDYNSELDEEGWHTVGLEEVVAEIGILGGEEKRRYLTTIMTSRY